jgi:hypothetical protein
VEDAVTVIEVTSSHVEIAGIAVAAATTNPMLHASVDPSTVKVLLQLSHTIRTRSLLALHPQSQPLAPLSQAFLMDFIKYTLFI